MESYFTEEPPEVLPRVEADRAADRLARERLKQESPEDFDPAGNLWPHWRNHYEQRQACDWDAAVNRILMGGAYCQVAKAFSCSTGKLFQAVSHAENISGGSFNLKSRRGRKHHG